MSPDDQRPQDTPTPGGAHDIPLRPTRLDYEHIAAAADPSLKFQFFAGMAFPVLWAIFAAIVMGIAVRFSEDSAAILGMLLLAGFVFSLLILPPKLKWKAFMPGVLCTILGLPLLAFVTCAIAALSQ